jgi:glycerate 2-kinase
MPMRVVIAPDSFKGSVGAAEAAAALAAGWQAARPADEVIQLPLADGGEGTLAVLAAADPGSRWHHVLVGGPGDALVKAAWLEMTGNVAVVELAAAAGLPLLVEPRPLDAHSFGVGELVGDALNADVGMIMITLGGSACTDGGTGLLAALGAKFADDAGRALPLGGGALGRLAAIDLTGLRRPPVGGVSCLTDVSAPLLGPTGAAAVFGPQKGASPDDIAVLENGLIRLAGLLGGDPAQPGAGAAGGCGYALATAWRARLLPGAVQIATTAGLPHALAGADLVITGEGRYDATSLTGKVVGTVRAMAARAGVPLAVVAGSVAEPALAGLGPTARSVELTALAGGHQEAMTEPLRWLIAAAGQLALDAAR